MSNLYGVDARARRVAKVLMRVRFQTRKNNYKTRRRYTFQFQGLGQNVESPGDNGLIERFNAH